MTRRVLVTGASGFVGSAAVRALVADGNQVHALVRATSDLSRMNGLVPTEGYGTAVERESAAPRVVLHRADVRDLASLQGVFRAAAPTHVLHTAIAGVRSGAVDESDLVATNVVGTHNLLLCCRESAVECALYTGGSSEYGHKTNAMTEHDLPEPVGIYGASKASASLLFQQAAREHGLRAIVLRLFSVYGPREPAHRLVPTAIRAALDGALLPLTAGTARRDFVFVDDCVRACQHVLDGAGDAGEIYNIGTGVETSNEEIVALIERLANRPISILRGGYAPRATDTPHWAADRSKAKRQLGWEPVTSLERGLRATIDFEQARRGLESE